MDGSSGSDGVKKLSMEQKRDLIHEMTKWGGPVKDMLQTWNRQEILEILCMEIGKERKYTGLTKVELIQRLQKTVADKTLPARDIVNVSNMQPPSVIDEMNPKRQRKLEEPYRFPIAATSSLDLDSGDTPCCKNSACQAKLNQDDIFCKRCSCCICRKYDDNKDPGLWLICSSEPPFCGPSCSMSCHLECALRHANSGILKDRQDKGLDGSFCCVSCGKENDLLNSLRKQLVAARDTRRVDELCYRLSLGQRILAGTKHYQNLYRIINEAIKRLEQEVGPLTGQRVKTARGIVNRLSSGQEVQKLCASAVDALDALDLIHSGPGTDRNKPFDFSAIAKKLVWFEDICPSSVTVVLNCDDSKLGNVVGYYVWHRRADDAQFPTKPTCKLFKLNAKYVLSGLAPATRYVLRVDTYDTEQQTGFCELQFRTAFNPDELINLNAEPVEEESSRSPNTNCSTLSNPSSVDDEANNAVPRNNYLAFCGTSNKVSSANLRADTINGLVQGQPVTEREIISLSDDEYSMEIKKDSLAVVNKEVSDRRMVAQENAAGGSNMALPTNTGKLLQTLTNSANLPNLNRSAVAQLPMTPCKLENLKDSTAWNCTPKLNGKDIVCAAPLTNGEEPQAGSSSKKRSIEKREERAGIADKGFEYYVKVIRRLECDGHIETSFRQKFLTWYSLRANPQQTRIVKAFIDAFTEDPKSLAEQLVDTFSNVVANQRSSTVPVGFCTKLWH